jgi:hypothetical protein
MDKIMDKVATLQNGCTAQITEDRRMLHVYKEGGELLFSLPPPEHGIFYTLQPHAKYGPCPIVRFDLDHSINGWGDWFYRIDFKKKYLERLNPWK